MCESVHLNVCVFVDFIYKICVYLMSITVTSCYTNTTFTGELAATRVFSRLRACTERVHHSVHKKPAVGSYFKSL